MPALARNEMAFYHITRHHLHQNEISIRPGSFECGVGGLTKVSSIKKSFQALKLVDFLHFLFSLRRCNVDCESKTTSANLERWFYDAGSHPQSAVVERERGEHLMHSWGIIFLWVASEEVLKSRGLLGAVIKSSSGFMEDCQTMTSLRSSEREGSQFLEGNIPHECPPHRWAYDAFSCK